MSCDLVLTISALACCIAEGKSSDEITLLAAVFSQLGDTLATITAQQDLCAPGNSDAAPHISRTSGHTISGGDDHES